MNLINEVFGSGFELYKFLNQKARTKNIYKRLLIRELKNNMERLEHRNRSGVNRAAVIAKLENSSILEAIKNDYDMSKLAPKLRVDEEVIAILYQAKRYKGWDAERILLSIDEKIVDLKELGIFIRLLKRFRLTLQPG